MLDVGAAQAGGELNDLVGLDREGGGDGVRLLHYLLAHAMPGTMGRHGEAPLATAWRRITVRAGFGA